jgi:hypothetical protein
MLLLLLPLLQQGLLIRASVATLLLSLLLLPKPSKVAGVAKVAG